jgi:hypothetical protein
MLYALVLLAQDFSFAPPDATFLASLNLRQVRGAIDSLAREAGIKSAASWKVLDRVERVQLAITMKGEEAQMLALLEGQFKAEDVEELRKGAKGRDAMDIKLLDGRRILIGDREMMTPGTKTSIAGMFDGPSIKGQRRPAGPSLPPAESALQQALERLPVQKWPAPPPVVRPPAVAVVHGMSSGTLTMRID